jgi:hypothetical protein
LLRKFLILASPTENCVIVSADAGGGQFLHRQLAALLQKLLLEPGDALLRGLDVSVKWFLLSWHGLTRV